MAITDRAKDLVIGGQWISSQEIERHALSHPAVAMATIGVPHQKWGERPRLIIQRSAGTNVRWLTGYIEACILRERSLLGGCRTRSRSVMRCL